MSMTPERPKELPKKSQFAPKSFTDPNVKEPIKDQIDAIVKVQDLLINQDVLNQAMLVNGRDRTLPKNGQGLNFTAEK